MVCCPTGPRGQHRDADRNRQVKKKRTIKRRNRLESQIVKAAQTNENEALALAAMGGQRPLVEQAVWVYLLGKEIEKEQLFDNDPDGTKRALATKMLCTLFLDAVDQRDGNMLRAIARAAENFERNPADQLRHDILLIKGILDRSGGTVTVQFLAAWIHEMRTGKLPKAPLPTEDSYSRLRRLAKSLKFPLAKDKIGRPKKAEK